MAAQSLTRILMVEDEPDIQAVARLALEALGGFQVRMCSSGHEATQAAPSFSPDLVLLDVMMPGMDGPSTLRALRGLPELSATPVIFMTAKIQPQELAHYKSLGVLDVIAKPFDPMTLAATVKSIWGRYQPLPVQASLDTLSENFIENLPAKLVAIDMAWAALQHTWDAEPLTKLHRLAHSLHGSSTTLAIERLGVAAGDLEHALALLDPSTPPSADQRAHIDSLIAQLKQEQPQIGERPAPGGAQPTTLTLPQVMIDQGSRLENRQIFLAEIDPMRAMELATQLGYFGYTVEILATRAELAEHADAAPAAVLTTVAALDALRGSGRVRPYAEEDTAPPFIVLADRGDMETRLQAARAGANAYFTQPVNIVALIDKLDALTSRQAEEPYRILVVDDEQVLADYYAATLRHANMMVDVVTDPMRVIQALPDFQPDLILMDMYMPGCDGLELASVIRQQEDYISVPIVFLSAETNKDMHLEAMRMGGDDFITKPIKAEHLISSVSSRVERSRTLRAFMVRDSLTGLYNHTTTKGLLEVELARARRHRTALAFAIIDIDHFKSVNDTYGHPIGDRVLKSLSRLLRDRLRKTDIIGRYGGEEFAIVLVNTDGPTAVAVLEEIRAGLSRLHQQANGSTFTVTFSCGLACFSDYTDAPKLTDAADKALYAAKRGGRNRVVLARALKAESD